MRLRVAWVRMYSGQRRAFIVTVYSSGHTGVSESGGPFKGVLFYLGQKGAPPFWEMPILLVVLNHSVSAVLSCI